MALGPVHLFAPAVFLAVFLALVAPVMSLSSGDGRWLLQLASSLDENEGRPMGQFWDMPPYTNDAGIMEQDPRYLIQAPRSLDRNKKTYDFDGLLCCNHPPTKPPSTFVKRNTDEKLMSLISKLKQSIANDVSGKQLENDLFETDDFRSDFNELRPETDNFRSGSNDGNFLSRRSGITDDKRGYYTIGGGNYKLGG